MGYIHGGQLDLNIKLAVETDTTDNLSTYTAVLHFRKDSLPLTSESTVTATLTVVTSVLTYVGYALSAASTVVPAGDYNLIIDGELTNPTTTLTRRTSPVIIHINRFGQIPYSET